jgi:hypothetical protein
VRKRRDAKSSSLVKIAMPCATAFPYHRIARIAQSDIDDVQGFVSRRGKHALEPRRQLRIDEDSHRAAATRIG